jgi:hypothetical protein
MLRSIDQYQVDSGFEQQKKEAKEKLKEFIQTIEDDLYPERKKKKGGS